MYVCGDLKCFMDAYLRCKQDAWLRATQKRFPLIYWPVFCRFLLPCQKMLP